MKNKGLISLLTAGIIALSQVVSSFGPCMVMAEEALAADSAAVIEIGDAEAFYDFALQCRNQEYSKGREFVLTADIDLADFSNITVPYMDGIFEGKNHSITGLVIDEDISDCGLFRFVGEDGIVRNLTVDAHIVSDEEQQHIGIIAGSNQGIIAECTSKGSINAQSRVGGIAGINEENAKIKDCVNEASIDGKYRAGGIAGENAGLISDCRNSGSINVSSRIKKKVASGDGDAVNISIPNAVTGLAADERANETGGIAGMSSGDVIFCKNDGQVGSSQLGNCTGGIIGRMSGYAAENENYGKISGRQNVGGIVGFLDPYSVKSLDRDYYDEFKAEIDSLHDITDELRDSVKKTGDDLFDDAEVISNRVKNIRNIVRGYADGFESDFDRADDKLDEETDNLKDAVDDMDVKLHIKQLSEHYNRLAADISGILKILAYLKKSITALDGDSKTVADYEKYVNELMDTAKELAEFIEKLAAEYGISVKLANLSKISDIKSDEAPSLQELKNQLNEYAEDARQQIESIREYLSKWPKKAKRLRNALKDSKDSLFTISDIADELFDDTRARAGALKNDIRNEGDALESELDGTRDRLRDDIDEVDANLRRMTDQLTLVRTTISDAKSEIRDRIKDRSVYVDVSEKAQPVESDGRILYCDNHGEVSAHTMSGGIVGCIGIDEVKDTAFDVFDDFKYNDDDSDDEEDDDDESDTDSVTKHVLALVYSCKNAADISSENGYCGGVCGKADYGRIADCESYCDISSEDGKYAGGIAGKSGKIIENCYVLGGVSAKAFAGGVCGKGNDISGNMVCSYLDMPEEEYVKAAGAIAGKVTGTVSSNVFVDNGFGAVDNVTKLQEAKGMSYAAMLGAYDLPAEFSSFTVKFVDGDNTVFTKEFAYGDEYKESEYPNLQGAEGEYAYWEKKTVSPVNRNVTIHSVRRVFVPAVSAADEGKTRLIFAGEFYPDSSMTVRRADDGEWTLIDAVKSIILPDIHYIYTDIYRYDITQEEPVSGNVIIRVAKGTLPANAIMVLDENYQPLSGVIEAEEVESFLSCESVIKDKGYIVVIEHVSNIAVATAIIVLFIVLVCISFLAVVFKRWRGKRRALKNEEKQEVLGEE